MAKVKNPRLGKAGGQAVLEGVMMRCSERYATAVRRQDGTIALKTGHVSSARKKYKIANIPIIRGVVAFVESLIFSYRTLSESTEMTGLADNVEPETKFEKWLDRKFGDKLMNAVMIVGSVLGVVLAVALFIFLPTLITSLIEKAAGGEGKLGLWKNVISGVIKILIFIGYMLAVSCMKDIRRTFEYHGAEHKTIFCYEAGEELTAENVKKYKRFHPRCGTSFIFVILLISILVSVIVNYFVNTWSNLGIQFLTKLLLLPLIVGISFEFLMYAGKHENLFTKICSAPGLWMQRITTKEPDESQIECAITALKASMPDEFPDFHYDDPHAAENASQAAGRDGETGPEETAVEEISGETAGDAAEKEENESDGL
ncbi:MAG: DUF1385 domain-containing protein [Clostridia bacterium]|nr:DUF1385 domain-containing protein [Clostridia bacterium]